MRLVRTLAACAVLVGGVTAGCRSSQPLPTPHTAPIIKTRPVFDTSTTSTVAVTIEALPQRFFPHPLPANTEPIEYHGGAVMTGRSNLYLIWYGPWSGNARKARKAVITSFIRHLDGPWWAISRGYTDAEKAAVGAAPRLVKEVTDRGSVGVAQVTDLQIRQVVQTALAAKRVPLDEHGIYMVITSSAVNKVGFLTQFCGWHSYFSSGATAVKYSFVGDPTGPLAKNCAPQSVSPNGDLGGDAMVSTIAHELTETVTDPTMRGWRTMSGEENADRCAWQYGTLERLPSGAFANVTMGHKKYLVQTNWVNGANPHCAVA